MSSTTGAVTMCNKVKTVSVRHFSANLLSELPIGLDS